MSNSPYLVVGLGNPGTKYANTPHNLGFQVVDVLAERWGMSFKKERKFKGELGYSDREQGRVYLLKPQTYMNLSGQSVGPVSRFYKVEADSNLMVVSDDIDLPVGVIRIRPKGSAGGAQRTEERD